MKGKEKVTIGHIWGAIYPALLYLLVQEVVSIIFVAIAIYQNKITVGKNGTDLDAFIIKYSLILTFFSALITVPILILIKRRDIKMQKSIGAYSYKSVSFFKYLLIIPFSICFTYAANIFVRIIEELIPAIKDSDKIVTQSIYSANIYIQIATAVILGPMVEELIFRGLMYIRLKRMFGPGIAAFVTGIMFGLIHGNFSQGIYAFIISYGAIFVYENYKNICAPILLHMVSNGFGVLVTYLFNDYNNSSNSIETNVNESAQLPGLIIFFVFSAAFSLLFGFCIKKYVNPRKK